MSPPRTETATAVRRLRALYAGADDRTRAAGRAWYPLAAREASALARQAPPGIGQAGAAAVIAALSPRMRWAPNLAEARLACVAAARVGADPWLGAPELRADAIAAACASACTNAFSRNVGKAARILAGEAPGSVLSGPKTCAFHAAILGDRDAVTIDVWAALAAGFDPDRLTARRLRVIDRAYRCAAEWAGEAPRDFQAIVWIAKRGRAT